MQYFCRDCIEKDHKDTDEQECDGGEIIDCGKDPLSIAELEDIQFKCIKNCGKENMGYEEAFLHLKTCEVSTTKTKIERLLLQLSSEDKAVAWEDKSRCKRCKCVPFPAVFFCKCAVGLYCECCRAHDEEWQKCNKQIRSINFMSHEDFIKRIFEYQVQKFKCRFCNKAHVWDALAIHERIWYINENKHANKDENKYITSEQYLIMMEEILNKVQDNFNFRMAKFEEDTLNQRKKTAKAKNEELSEENIKQFKDYINDIRSQDKREAFIKEELDLIKNYPYTLEPPAKDQNVFVMFKKFDKMYTHFKFEKQKINPGVQQRLHKTSRSLVQADGFKIIQTPLSNRIFLVGGDEDAWGTYEFDPVKKRFLDRNQLKSTDDDERYLIMNIGIGRSHHSLAATSGLIFVTGGKKDYLRREDDDEFDADEANGRIIEVLKLKDGMWIEYTNRLMNARCCHSSCIMGSYLYLFHGYDVTDSVLNWVSIERIKIDVNEARLVQEPGYNSVYVIKEDRLDRFLRSFTAVYPCQEGNKIIYFGYTGLEGESRTPFDQQDLIRTDPDKQKYGKFTMRDEYPRFHLVRTILKEEVDEFQVAINEHAVSYFNIEFIG